MNDNLDELKNKILCFLEAQPGFKLYKNEELRVFREDRKDLG
jgi:hypothetical protein